MAPGYEKWNHRGDVPCGAGSGMLQSGGGLSQVVMLLKESGKIVQ